MSSQKTERLINLTLALLATKRHLTKSEIFKTVAGYSGSPETMERMFERDKDELRNLGIQIEVKEIDALFEEEYYINTLKIPADYVKGFQFYCIEDEKLATALRSKNKTMTMFLIVPLAEKYNDLMDFKDE